MFVSLFLECVSLFRVCFVSPSGVFVMFLSSYVWVCLVLVLLKMMLLMFLGIWKACIEDGTVAIITRAHLSQSKIIHHLRISTFGMSIAGIRHVDSWGVVPPTSVYLIGASEYWANNGCYVIRSFVILLLSGMLVQFGSLGISSISFLVSRILNSMC